MRKIIRVGSRDSALAIAQTKLIIDAIKAARPGLEIELVSMKTSGDLNMKPFAEASDKFGIKGLFTKELEEALECGELDFAVHSLKDMPLVKNEKLPIVALSRRADARDALVLPKSGERLAGKPIGCSSARRRLQLLELEPRSEVYPIRGNVLTRLNKLDSGEYSSLILAAAGLHRAGLGERISRLFGVDEMIPAAGQGILACQGRADEDYGFLDAVRCAESTVCAEAERSFSAALGGGCTSPVASYAELRGDRLFLRGFYCDEESGVRLRGTVEGAASDAAKLGEELAGTLKERERGWLA